jgi:CheY-like chemotaxis protein
MMLTSGGPPAEGKRRQELGILSYLTKPIKQADLWKAVLRALGMPLAPDESPEHVQAEPGVGRPLRILLAEDNLVNQKLAVRLLQKRGHEVVVAGNGREALDAWQKELFDVVLMDVQMPEMDGFETTAAIRRTEKGTGKHQPIIAMTAYAMKGDRERCLAAGMDRYISKPVRTQELFTNIAEIVPDAPQVQVEAKSQVTECLSCAALLDEVEALARVGGDRDLLVELAEVFLEECPGLMKAVEGAVASGDPARVKAAAHSLKGAVDNFAARDAFEAALRLEMLGRDGNLSGIHEAWSTLQREIERLKPALAGLGAKVG